MPLTDNPAKDAGGSILDRSTVRVLLCDQDPITAVQLVGLLQKCSYQVTAVKTARQVVEVLDSSGPEVDLILTEVELPREKGFKLLKHIVRQERLQRIPIVMMSAQDEMAIVVKCLRLGAVDYLVKPLRTNELLNLWTHTWRRRRMLGLAEKHSICGSLNIPYALVSDTSESNNTNSTNFFSDDTDDRKRIFTTQRVVSTFGTSDFESNMSPQLELSLKPSSDLSAGVGSKRCVTAGSVPSPPRKIQLRMGQSSAFLAYVKANNKLNQHPRNVQQPNACTGSGDISKGRDLWERPHMHPPRQPAVLGVPSAEVSPEGTNFNWKAPGKNKNGPLTSDNQDSSSGGTNSSPLPCELLCSNQFLSTPMHGLSNGHSNVDAVPLLPPAQFLSGRMINPSLHPTAMLPPQSIPLYHSFLQEKAVGITPAINVLPPGHGFPLTTAFSFFPFGFHSAPQFGPFTAWPGMPAASPMGHKLGQAERREAALKKFRHKRKDRCFEKKIRYVSRQKLADQRPRIRGQFVRRTNGIEGKENDGMDESDDEAEDDECVYSEMGLDSSLENA